MCVYVPCACPDMYYMDVRVCIDSGGLTPQTRVRMQRHIHIYIAGDREACPTTRAGGGVRGG